MTTIFLCRHGETEFSRDDRYYYRENPPVTTTGHRQIEGLAERLKEEPISAVFSSPLERALCTAESIAFRHGLPVDILPSLVEWNPGDWRGLRREVVRSDFSKEYGLWALDPAAYPPPLGESCYDVAARVIPPFTSIAEAHIDNTIAVIGHRTVNRIILAHSLGISINQYREKILQDPGALNKLCYKGRGIWSVGLLNGHVPAPCREDDVVLDGSATGIGTQSDFLDQLKLVHGKLQVIWPEGRNPCVPGDGRHWRLPSFARPVSVGRVEAFLLYNLAVTFAPRIIVEIGTGFGYSSLWLAAGATASGSPSILFTIDDHSEGGLGHEGLRFARWASKVTGLHNKIRFVHGSSPEVLSTILNEARIDFSFIDGNHHGEQSYLDFKGVSETMDQGGIIVWHDVDQRYAVPQAFQRAMDEGWRGKIFYTSCRLGVSYKKPEYEVLIDRAFEAACNLQTISRTPDPLG